MNTPIYILSQILILISYTLLIITYHINNRNKVIMINLISLTITMLSYLCLSAYAGMSMEIIAIIRNIIFYKFDKNENNHKNNTNLLIIIYFLTVILAIITYNGLLSITSVLASIIYTYSIWQKNPRRYKILGIPVGILGAIYNIYISSILGIVLETSLMVSSIIGLTKESNIKKINNNALLN